MWGFPCRARSGDNDPVLSLLLLHVLIWILIALVVGITFRRWVRQEDISPGLALGVGLALLAFLLLLLPLPLLKSGPGWPKAAQTMGRVQEYWAGNGLAALALVALVVAFARGARSLGIRQVLGETILEPTSLALAGGRWQEEDAFRAEVERRFQEELRIPALQLCFTARMVLPFTTGFFRPRIFVPHWLLRHSEVYSYAKVLLNHEREHVRLNHHRLAWALNFLQSLLPPLGPLAQGLREAMEVQADRRLLAQAPEFTRSKYLEGLARVVEGTPEALALGIGHDPAQVPLRIRQALGKASPHFRGLVAILILLLPLVITWRLVGRLDLEAATSLVMLDPPSWVRGYAEPDGLELRPIPGKGGTPRAEDGVVVDTTGVRSGQWSVMRLYYYRLPLRRSKLLMEVSLDWHLRASGTRHPFLLRELYFRTFPRADHMMYEERADLDLKELDGSRGRASLSLRQIEIEEMTNPTSAGQMERLVLYVPPGCRLEITGLGAREVDGIPRPIEQVKALSQRFTTLLEGFRLDPESPLDWNLGRTHTGGS